jgi:hypothetical protein
MSLNRLNWDPSERELSIFGLAQFFVSLTVVYVVGFSASLAATLILVTGFIAVIGCFLPKYLKLNFLGFSLLTYPLGFCFSHVIMFALFCFVFVPIAIVLRVLRKVPLEMDTQPQLGSYWKESDSSTDKRTYVKQF